jgi:hypothetical protein
MGLYEHYEKAAHYVGKPEFRRWQDDPEEPRNWAGVARFLDLAGGNEHVSPAKRLKEIRTAIQAVYDWCKAHDTVYLTRGGNAGSPIHVSDLASMQDFLQALIYRFPEAFEKRGRDRAGDEDKPFWDWD